MKVDVSSMIRAQLKLRIARSKVALAKKAKNIAAMEKELAKYTKRK